MTDEIENGIWTHWSFSSFLVHFWSVVWVICEASSGLGHVWDNIWGNSGQQWTTIRGATCICETVFYMPRLPFEQFTESVPSSRVEEYK